MKPLRPFRRLFAWLAGSESTKRSVRAGYEAANDGAINRAHFANADFLGPNSANSPEVAAAIRSKARHERENDGCLNGVGKQLGVDLIGTGPRLQINSTEPQRSAARQVEQHWRQWFRASVMLEKLRLIVEPRPFDGEVFGLFITNPTIGHPVKLDVSVIEADQVTTPTYGFANTNASVDGIEYDQYGNPLVYHVLREHPGDGVFQYGAKEFDRVPASQVIHWFRPDRPSQGRGVSEFAPVINTGAQLRRYSQATLTAAELTANITGAIETDLPISDGDEGDEGTPTLKPGEKIRPTMGTILTLTNRAKLNIVKPEQPTSTHKEFVELKRSDLGRPVGISKNQVTGNSDGASYSSGRLDRLDPQARCWVERERFRLLVLDRLFVAWLAEATLLGLVPASLNIHETGWNWNFDGFPSIDPWKDANAQEKRINTGVSNLAIECALDGYDWREVLTQRAEEIKLMRELGIPVPGDIPKAAIVAPPVDDDEEEDDDTDLAPNRRAEVTHA